jgi:hypothetical protein
MILVVEGYLAHGGRQLDYVCCEGCSGKSGDGKHCYYGGDFFHVIYSPCCFFAAILAIAVIFPNSFQALRNFNFTCEASISGHQPASPNITS